MKYKAVIFDLDGTLLDTVHDIAVAMNNVLEKHFLPLHSAEQYRHFIGNGLRNLVYKAVPENIRQNSELLNFYLNDLIIEYRNCMDKYTKPYPGIMELLNNLKKLGLKLAILSNKDHQFMPDIIKTHFLTQEFSVAFGARVGIPIKPSPEGALEIADLIELQPQEIIFVGDTDVDMETATRAKMYPVGALWGFRSKEELVSNGAKLLLNHPLELLKLFN